MNGWAGFWIGLGIAFSSWALAESLEVLVDKVVDYLKWKELTK